MVLLGIIRLLTPIDFDRAYVVRSYQVIPAIENFIHRPFSGSYTLGSLLLFIWLAGTVIFLVRDIVKQIRFVRTSRNYPPSDRRDLIDLAGEFGSNFGLLVSSSISRPYTAGLFRPTIYLPDIELPEEQWRTILRHEVQHIRSHDEAKKLFFLAIQALFWWNPLAHISRKEIDTILELQCDTLKGKTFQPTIPVVASTLAWDQKQLAVRFEALQDAGYSVKKHPRAIAYILLLTIFLLSYFVIIQPFGLASEKDFSEDVMDSDIVIVDDYLGYESDMYIVFEDGQYYLYTNGILVNQISQENLSNEPFCSLPIIGGNK